MIEEPHLLTVKNAVGAVSYFSNDIFICTAVTRSGKIYEQDAIFEYLLPSVAKANLILDIGAHAGSHSICYRYINPQARILAFEPQRKIYELLNYNIEQNNLQNVETLNMAVANKSSTTTLVSIIEELGTTIPVSYDPNIDTNLGGVYLGEGGEAVKTVTIDSLNLPACDFIKLDIEGAEPLAILGAENTIKKFRPVIMFEKNHKQLRKETFESFGISGSIPTAEQILRDYGYTFISRLGDTDNYLALK